MQNAHKNSARLRADARTARRVQNGPKVRLMTESCITRFYHEARPNSINAWFGTINRDSHHNK